MSAVPDKAEQAGAEHRLYAIRDGALPCSAAEWAELAKAEIQRTHGLGKLPILVGGTGLYLRTLLDGIAPVPAIDEGIRTQVRARDVQANRDELLHYDPEGAALLGPGDTARISRALEVVKSTGRTLKQWQAERSGGIGDTVGLRAVVLLPPRAWLYERCDARFARMIGQGVIGEVDRLLARNLDPGLPVMRAIGVREIAAHLRGELGREAMTAAGQQSTRRYAKRQYTWFSHQPPAKWPRFTGPSDELAPVLALLRQKP